MEQIRDRVNKARKMVSDLCNKRREWIMSIPADRERDPDLVIADGLDAVEDLLEMIEEMRDCLEEFGQHQSPCLLSFFSAGRNTPDGGYECKYGDKWYQSQPVDETPKCTCGLNEALAIGHGGEGVQ
jgi:hypothetical protein